MVVYSSSPYDVVQAAGNIIDSIISELVHGIKNPEDVDLVRAEALITTKLTPFLKEHNVDLTEDWHSLDRLATA